MTKNNKLDDHNLHMINECFYRITERLVEDGIVTRHQVNSIVTSTSLTSLVGDPKVLSSYPQVTPDGELETYMKQLNNCIYNINMYYLTKTHKL